MAAALLVEVSAVPVLIFSFLVLYGLLDTAVM